MSTVTTSASTSRSKKKQTIAIAYINDAKIKGTVYFYEKDKSVAIEIDLIGLPAQAKLGFHIHEAGDLTDGCMSACAHLNPFHKTHGGPKSATRHVGDLGNITTDANGMCKMKMEDSMITLRGTRCNVIGRAVVIHEKTDDLGLGGDEESLKTGNAGKRIACAVIGYSKKMFV
jgi:Cu-Zn family superoxide dismutase